MVTSVAAFVAAAVIAVIAVPWDAGVAPWADLDAAMLSEFTTEQIASITAFAAAAWPPGVLGLLAGPLAAVTVFLIPAVRRRTMAIGSRGTSGTGRAVVRDVLVAGVVLTIVRLAALPFAVWSAQVRRDAGLLVEPWGNWWLRWTGESIAYVVLGAVAIAAGLAVLRRWPRRGWVAVTAGAAIAILAVTALLPLMQRIEGTTADPALTARVLEIADRAGVDVGSVTVIAVADTSPAVNANVSGWGPTRTVTVYDTVSATMSDAEIDALIAHELIHARDADAVLGAVLATLGGVGVVALACGLVLSSRVRDWLGGSGVVPMVVAVLLTASLAATVVGANISRSIEARADREALALTGDSQAYRDLIVRLAITNRSTLTPAQWRYALFFTHPTPLQRLAALKR
jgi:STE24 endopeptidase